MNTVSFLAILLSFALTSDAQNENWYLCKFMPWICPQTVSPTLSPSPTATIATNSPTFPSEVTNETTSSNPSGPTEAPTYPRRPNLIMILTDQQSVRSLGCYREFFKRQNQTEQAHVWGEGIEVETPHIDKLAEEGTIFTNFHTVAPLCTPSRASFMSGLYPQKTGDTGYNHGEMDENVVTFAKILRQQRKYKTGYFGKWHLNGLSKPGWGNKNRKFGFEYNKHLWNRGHWKFLDEVNGTMKEYKLEDRHLFEGKEDNHFTTDYLFDRGIEFIEKAREKDEPFAMVLSIPDPHSPNEVRQPYEDMYTDMKFNLPHTTWTAVTKNPAVPDWNYNDHNNVTLNEAEEYLLEFQDSRMFQKYLQQYFGMVKCIDDNVGKLMNYLKESGIEEEDTIIVFTADHGDMLGEHGKFNKGRPYRGAANVPFIIRQPGRVPQGKIIKTARSSIDFVPSILSLMNANDESMHFDGIDFSKELLNTKNETNRSDIVFTFDTGKTPIWAAAIKRNYKLVMSKGDIPWLFDLDKDPYEIVNHFDRPGYSKIQQELQDALYVEMKEHKIPLSEHTRFIFWNTPICYDSRDSIKIGPNAYVTCADLDSTSDKCSKERFKKLCPKTCDSCCTDTMNKPFWLEGELKYCSELKDFCRKKMVAKFCPTTCQKFTGCRWN